MLKKYILAVIVVFVVWVVLDYLIHGVMLESTYLATKELWRPCDDVNRSWMWLSTLITSFAFVAVYASLISPKSLDLGAKYGLAVGVLLGIPMSLGLYSVMPIPFYLTGIWLVVTLVEGLIGGLIVGMMVKE